MLTLRGLRETLLGLSDLPTLASRYTEVEICGGLPGTPSTFLPTETLVDSPHIIAGYHEDGLPMLIGVKQTLKAHASFVGGTRSGKTIGMSKFAEALPRLGFTTLAISFKEFEPALFATMKSGAEALTRIGEDGKPVAAPFRFGTLQHGVPTSGFNYIQELDPRIPKWMQSAKLISALNNSQKDVDGAQQYFLQAANEFCISAAWGRSFGEFHHNNQKIKASRDAQYATAGVRHAIAQQAAIEPLNCSSENPANVDLKWLHKARGAFYFNTHARELREIGSTAGVLLALAFIDAKTRVDPTNLTTAFLILDEVQCISTVILNRFIEQTSSCGIRVLFAYHNLSQMGENTESTSMAGVKFFFSAVPGEKTERNIQALFGMKKSYIPTFGFNSGSADGLGTSDNGMTVTLQKHHTTSRGDQFGFSEKEEPHFTPNDTLALNYDPSAFVLSVSPGTEYARFGPTAIKGISGGPSMPFHEIDRKSLEVSHPTPHTFLVGSTPQVAPTNGAPKALPNDPMQTLLLRTAERIKAQL